MSKFANILGGTHILNDGNEMPMIGLGVSRINGQEEVDIAVRAAFEAGYRLFDTAEMYGNQTELGNALKKCLPQFNLTRSDVFITTKIPIVDEDPENWAYRQVESSLSKLQTEMYYIDLMLLHYPWDRKVGKDSDFATNRKGRKAVWGALEQLRDNGKLRSIGVSNFQIMHLIRMKDYAKVTPAVNQVEYHPYFTSDQIRHYCKENGIHVQAFSSLCWANQEILNESSVQCLAKKFDVTPQTILYAFAVNSGVAIIPKSANPQRITDNLNKGSHNGQKAVFLSKAKRELRSSSDNFTEIVWKYEIIRAFALHNASL